MKRNKTLSYMRVIWYAALTDEYKRFFNSEYEKIPEIGSAGYKLFLKRYRYLNKRCFKLSRMYSDFEKMFLSAKRSKEPEQEVQRIAYSEQSNPIVKIG